MTEEIFNQPQFYNDDAARDFLEAIRWSHGPVCPHCGSNYANSTQSRLTGPTCRPGLIYCGQCHKQYTVTVGTIFERSKIPLHKWVLAVHLMCASKKGMSSLQLSKMLGLTYKSAWFMTHRIREAMSKGGFTTKLGGTSGIVEADETYWGNTGKQKKGARGYDHKMKVVSLVEREGEKRSFHVSKVNAQTVGDILTTQVSKKSRLMTDQAAVYTKIGKKFKEHGVVNHARGEYARGDITTNTVESSFAILKRGLYGIHHYVSAKHMRRYLKQFDFLWNHREYLGYTNTDRAAEVIKSSKGKRLTYKKLTE
jgi:transposase-like protein